MTGGSHVHLDKYLGVAWRTVRDNYFLTHALGGSKGGVTAEAVLRRRRHAMEGEKDWEA